MCLNVAVHVSAAVEGRGIAVEIFRTKNEDDG
ncbi:hypothetical protein BIW11_04476 [Tropilaelaps mercedesae]|uniref:Uncharacterized protein n=1 Tax=Tropilaelaps mercedesae TaxID=418985 RepID=A0A1V9X5K9_9ACAR|nr:hypothetical protein BIW11_04476 [Tropilaelaps mercedesae]